MLSVIAQEAKTSKYSHNKPLARPQRTPPTRQDCGRTPIPSSAFRRAHALLSYLLLVPQTLISPYYSPSPSPLPTLSPPYLPSFSHLPSVPSPYTIFHRISRTIAFSFLLHTPSLLYLLFTSTYSSPFISRLPCFPQPRPFPLHSVHPVLPILFPSHSVPLSFLHLYLLSIIPSLTPHSPVSTSPPSFHNPRTLPFNHS